MKSLDIENRQALKLESAVFFSELETYCQRHTRFFHMPGAGGSQLVPPFSSFDITELETTDDLNSPKPLGTLVQAQVKAAKYFAVEKTEFLSEGSSQGIYAALFALSANRKNASILVPRVIHRSFMNAAIRFGLNVVFAYPKEESSSFSSPLSYPRAEDYEEILSKDDTIVLAVYCAPDYYAHCVDGASIYEVCQKYKCPLLLDAAHGAHMHIAENFRLKADIAIESAHKTLPALTGAAYLHIVHDSLDCFGTRLSTSIARALRLLRGTSPPLYVAAACDWARAFIEEQGEKYLARQRELREYFQALLNPNIKIMAQDQFSDPLRLIIDLSAYGDARVWERCLAEIYGISVEFADLIRLVLLPSLFSTKKAYKDLAEALNALAQSTAVLPKLEQEKLLSLDKEYYARLSGLKTTGTLAAKLEAGDLQAGMRVAMWAGSSPTRVKNQGLTKSPIIPYPPGIPYLWQGEDLDEYSANLLFKYMGEVKYEEC